MKKGLLIVDPQVDFISCTLPVSGAAPAMDLLAEHVMRHSNEYAAIMVTLDWHPMRHSSFSDEGGQWPVHCVAYTVGAAIYPNLSDALYHSDAPVQCFTKGKVKDREEYSIFQADGESERLQAMIEDMGITEINICGLAGDVCVYNTLLDGIKLCPNVRWHVLEEYSPSIDGGDKLHSAIESLKENH